MGREHASAFDSICVDGPRFPLKLSFFVAASERFFFFGARIILPFFVLPPKEIHFWGNDYHDIVLAGCVHMVWPRGLPGGRPRKKKTFFLTEAFDHLL